MENMTEEIFISKADINKTRESDREALEEMLTCYFVMMKYNLFSCTEIRSINKRINKFSSAHNLTIKNITFKDFEIIDHAKKKNE